MGRTGVEKATRRYESPVRAEKAAQTRDRILAAGAELVRAQPSWEQWREVTIHLVAEKAGVHDRTVYRHFAGERELRDAILQRLYEEAQIDIDDVHMDNLQHHVSAVLHYFASFNSFTPQPIEPFLATYDERRKDAVLRALGEAAPGWSEPDHRIVAALIDILWGVQTYQRFIIGWDFEVDEMTRAVGWLLDLIRTAVRDDHPPPPGARSARSARSAPSADDDG